MQQQDYPEQEPQYYEPIQPNIIKESGKDDDFLRWFLEMRQGINDLKHGWRGHERDEMDRWIVPVTPKQKADADYRRIMNEKGVHWAGSVMENYLGKVFQTTNWNDEHMCYEMRKAIRVVWFGLQAKWKDYGLRKVDTHCIGSEMLSMIHAMLLASRGDGIKNFIGTSQQINVSKIEQDTPRQGFMSGFAGIFRRGHV